MNKNSNNKKNRNQNRNHNQPRRFSPSERALELLGYYQETLCMGYSEENWTTASRILRDIGYHVDLETHREIGSLMTDAYVNPTIQNVILGCEKIAIRLQSNLNR